MSDTEISEEVRQAEELAPLPVVVINEKHGSDAAAFRSTQNYQPFTNSGTQAPQLLLPRDDNRKEAVVSVQDITQGGQTCFLCDSKQAQSGQAGLGFAVPIKGLNASFTFIYKSRQALYAVADGTNSNNVRISVLDQKYGNIQDEVYR